MIRMRVLATCSPTLVDEVVSDVSDARDVYGLSVQRSGSPGLRDGNPWPID